MQTLTARQKECLNCIIDHINENGYPPGLRDIGAVMGIKSTNGVTDHLIRLAGKGYISIVPKESRAIKVLRDSEGIQCRTRVIYIETA